MSKRLKSNRLSHLAHGSEITAEGDAQKRIEQLEADLAAMREALQSIAANTCCDKCQEAALVARAALGDA